MDHSEDIRQLKGTLYGNGKKGLVTLTSNLFDKVDSLANNIEAVQADVKVLLRFQTQIETEKQQHEIKIKEIRELKKQESINKRWFMGLTISTILGLVTIIISLIMSNRAPEETKITEREFEELIQEYQKDHKLRGSQSDTTYSELIVKL